MGGERELFVGFDLSNDYSQISTSLDPNTKPTSVVIDEERNRYLIPTVVGVKTTREWVCGEEAVRLWGEEDAAVCDNLIKNLQTGKKTLIYGTSFSPVVVLEKFFYKSLMLLKKKYPSNRVKKIVVTIKETNSVIVEGIYSALENIGIHSDRAFVQSYGQSYLYYALSQERELWMNDIGLFDFDEKGLFYSQISVQRRRSPYLAEVINKDYSKTLSYHMLDDLKEKDNLEYVLDHVMNDALYNQIVSTIYFTGIGFIEGLPEGVLKKLCKGRRLFLGQNLYCMGACYKAIDMEENKRNTEFTLISEESLRANVSMFLYDNGRENEFLLAKIGTPWYEASKTIHVILENEKEIQYKFMNLFSKEPRKESLSLEGLPERPSKTTRLEVTFTYTSPTTLILRVKDKGFGDFYPATNKIWEKEVDFYG